MIVREATMPAAANAKISFMRAPSCLMASTIQRSVFVYCYNDSQILVSTSDAVTAANATSNAVTRS